MLPSLTVAVFCCVLVPGSVAGSESVRPVPSAYASKAGPGAVTETQSWAQGTPPLYQRLHKPGAPSGGGTSMVFAVGDLQHSPVPLEPASPGRPAFAETCRLPPTLGQLRAFAVFQWMTREQAIALGVRFRPVHADAASPPSASALVWRTGHLAECAQDGGTAILVYGSEWDLGLQVGSTHPLKSIATAQDLGKKLSASELVAVGVSNGGREAESIDVSQPLEEMILSLQNSRPGPLPKEFMQAFERVRSRGSSAAGSAAPLEAIGFR